MYLAACLPQDLRRHSMFSFSELYDFSEGNNNEQKGIQRKEHDRDCGHVGGIVYIDAA